MSTCYPMTSYRQPLPPALSAYVEMGKIGAVVGLCGAGAANIRRLRREEISGGEVLVATLKTGVASGLATAAATMVASQFRGSTLSLLATLATGTAVMYALGAESRNPTSGDNA
jgi:hypothetical protein